MPTTRTLALTSLRLDGENPRLEAIADSNRDALRSLLTIQKDKVLALAADIVEFGAVNPAERIIATPDPRDSGHYFVIEGNRRVAALQILSNPRLADGILTVGENGKLKRWHDRFSVAPIERLDAVVFDDPEEATHWISLRHRGEQGGAGIVPGARPTRSAGRPDGGASASSCSCSTSLPHGARSPIRSEHRSPGKESRPSAG